jgi:hypothetical protein
MAPELQTTQEIHARLSDRARASELYREAFDENMALSRYLEIIDPTPQGEHLDAFGRQLKAAGIVTRNNPAAGYWASPALEMFENPLGRALFPEFAQSQWRSVTFAQPQERAILLSSDSIIGSFERPYVEAGPFWNNQFSPAIPLSELVASTTAITGVDYRSLFMTYDAEKLRLYRVGESADIPMTDLATSPRSVQLHKYGRGLRVSYEALRRIRVDKMAWWIRWQALQSEVDKVSAALAIIINGDGNANTGATNYNLLTLDPDATSGELSLKGWLSFRMKFTNPYALTTALMREAAALQLILLNTGSGNVPLMNLNLAGIGNSLTPINNVTGDGLRYGWTDEAPVSKIVGFDKRFSLEQITEIGSNIQETDRFISNQTQEMVMTETAGFAVLDPSAAKILTLNA